MRDFPVWSRRQWNPWNWQLWSVQTANTPEWAIVVGIDWSWIRGSKVAFWKTFRTEAIPIRLEAIALRLESIPIRLVHLVTNCPESKVIMVYVVKILLHYAWKDWKDLILCGDVTPMFAGKPLPLEDADRFIKADSPRTEFFCWFVAITHEEEFLWHLYSSCVSLLFVVQLLATLLDLAFLLFPFCLSMCVFLSYVLSCSERIPYGPMRQWFQRSQALPLAMCGRSRTQIEQDWMRSGRWMKMIAREDVCCVCAVIFHGSSYCHSLRQTPLKACSRIWRGRLGIWRAASGRSFHPF